MSIKLYPKKRFQIKFFINLEIIEEEDKNRKKKKIITIFLKSIKKFYNLVKPLSIILASKSNFYDMI